jgi:hypothetical protein
MRGAHAAAVATRAIRPHFINGEAVPGGYLGELRVEPHQRNGLILSRGYSFLRQLHEAQECSVYSTVINAENETALRILTSGRASLPSYAYKGRINVFCVTPKFRASANKARREVQRGTASLVPDFVGRLNLNRLQFARSYEVEDFSGAMFPGLQAKDFFYTSKGSKVTGVFAIWDQRLIRSVSVAAYPPLLEAFRLAVPALMVRLPVPGRQLALGYAAFISTATVDDFHSLLSRACDELTLRGLDGLVVSLHERDPRNRVLLGSTLSRSALDIFAVDFSDRISLDDGIPYFEAAFI